MVTKEQFTEWKAHPVTIAVYTEIKNVKRELEIALGSGTYISEHADTTHGAVSRIVGQIAGLNQLLGLSYDEEPSELY